MHTEHIFITTPLSADFRARSTWPRGSSTDTMQYDKHMKTTLVIRNQSHLLCNTLQQPWYLRLIIYEASNLLFLHLSAINAALTRIVYHLTQSHSTE